MAIRHWEKDKDKATVTIDGVPLLASEFEISPASDNAFEPVEKKIAEAGVLILAGHKAQREAKFKCEFIELTKEVISFIQSLDGKVVTLCSPHLGGCMKGHAKAEIKYDLGEWGHFVASAKDAKTYGEVTFTVKESIEPKSDLKLPTREEEKKEGRKVEAGEKKTVQTTQPAAKILDSFKPSCAFCATRRAPKGQRYRYIWYEVGWDNVCPRCGRATLTRYVSRRVPEAELKCTNKRCRASYCGVCGRRKVWNRKVAEKYRVKNVIPPKPKKKGRGRR